MMISGEIWAEDSGGDGPPLVLLHPAVGDASIWNPLMAPLAAQFRVIRYDRRGYGQTPPAQADHTLVGDLLAVLDNFGLDAPAIAGTSQGGGIAVDFTLAHPGRVRALALLCPAISGFPAPPEPELDARFAELITARDADGMVDFGVAEWGTAGDTPEVRRQLRSAAYAIFADTGHQRPDPPAWDRLAEIAVPTVIVVGDLDRKSIVDSSEQAAVIIPGATLIRLPGVDHFPTLRAPDMVAAAIIAHC